MKLHVFALSLSLLFFSHTTQAQYESMFGTNQTSWNVLTEELAGRFLDSLVACCDTTVSGENYKLIQHYRHADNALMGPTDIGLLREDTTTGEAWFLSLGDHVERKVCDMTLTIGDSFQIYNINPSVPGYSSAFVDSVYYVNGVKYIQLDTMPYYLTGNKKEKFTLVEGIGPNVGVHYGDSYWFIPFPYLLCAHKDGQQVYQNSNAAYGNYCNSLGIPYSVDDAKQVESAIKNYPNPFSESITMEYEGDGFLGATIITIYNVKGQRVMTEQWTSGASKTFATTTLPAGFYFMLLRKTNGQLLFHSTLVKQ